MSTQQAEVRVVHAVDQLLDPLAVLAEEAVVLDHGPDAEIGGELGDARGSP